MNITKENTKIIIDWDDTLFPTSWIMSNFISPFDGTPNAKLVQSLNILDTTLHDTLQEMIQLGNVVIITNATLLWIKYASRLLKKTKSLLKTINIISARGAKDYFKTAKENMTMWKEDTFKRVINGNKHRNIISIGDAEHEYIALTNLCQDGDTCFGYLKAIKFKPLPSFEQIIDQLNIMKKTIRTIVTQQRHMDMTFMPKN